MRLNAAQIEIIRQIVRAEATDAEVRLFGSRLNDAARGGDIDLLLTCTSDAPNPALLIARVAARIEQALDGQKVDVVLSAPNLMRLPIHEIAEKEGVLL